MEDDREIGELPLSIGTSLAIESLIERTNTLQYDSIYFNMDTIVRNYYQAWPTNKRRAIDIDVFVTDIIEEVEWLIELFTGMDIDCYLYKCSYKSLASQLPLGNIVVPSTQLQVEYDKIQDIVIEHVINKLKDTDNANHIKRYDSSITGNYDNAVFLTHKCTDLVLYKNFKSVYLLESHTGAIKGKSEWNSKLGGGSTERIPFNKLTLQIFGDNGKSIRALGSKVRKSILELATNNGWSHMTTIDKVKRNLSGLKNRYLYELLKGGL